MRLRERCIRTRPRPRPRQWERVITLEVVTAYVNQHENAKRRASIEDEDEDEYEDDCNQACWPSNAPQKTSILPEPRPIAPKRALDKT
jgi:hypothetical protein